MPEDSHKTLAFRALSIQRLLGISSEDNLRYADEFAFCDGINVIIGANATGKSTTAAALKAMLWPPRKGGEIDLQALIEVGGVPRDGKLFGNDITWTSPDTGEKMANPEVPEEAFSQCYGLALEELLAGKAKALSDKIEISVNGGYDLAAARQDLKFSEKVSGLSGLPGKLAGFETEVGKAINVQVDNEHDERVLDEKEAAAVKAAEAKDKTGAVACLLRYREALIEAEACRERRARFPEGIFNMRGDDLDGLESAMERQSTAGEQRAKLAGELEKLKALDLPETSVEAPVLAGLQDAINNSLKDAEKACGDTKEAAGIAAATAAAAREFVGPGISDERLAALLTADDLPEDLRDPAAKWQEAEAQHRETQRKVDVLKADGEESPAQHSDDTLRDGIGELRKWLRQPRSEVAAKNSRQVFIAAVIAAVLVILVLPMFTAVSLSNPVLWLSVVAVVAVVVLSWPQRATGTDDRGAAVLAGFQSTYETTGLPPPGAWEPEAVERCLGELQRDLDGVRLAAQKAEQKADHLRIAEQELAEKQETLDGCKKETEAVRDAWGLAEPLSPEGLRSLVDRLADWRNKVLNERTVASAQESATEEFEKHRAAVQRDVREFIPTATLDDYKTARVCYDQLVECREQQQRIAVLEETEIPRLDGELKQAAKEVTDMTGRLEQTGKDADELKATLEEWQGIRPDATSANDELTAAEIRCSDAETVKNGLAPALLEAIEGVDNDELEKQKEKLTEEAGTLDELNQNIGELRRKISDARIGSRFAEAQSNQQLAIDEAAAKCRDEAANLVGGMCADFIRSRCETQGSEVLVQAGKYLGAFTRDCHSQLVPAPGVGFKVHDDRRGLLAPEELSSATRVQLLIAARLAFLDDLEKATGVRLPLLLDEILCNSDDDRTSAVIGAVADIAAGGRQVFYFTAQHDEAGKWQAFGREWKQCALKIIALPIGHDPPPPIAINRPEWADVPEPAAGEGWESYLARIAPPPFDPFTATPALGELHLAYVIRDLPSLHGLLANGYSTWGQLQRLCERGGVEAIAKFVDGDGDQLFGRAAARLECLKKLLADWRIGRGVRVQLTDISKGGKAFIAQARQLAKSCKFDGERMIDQASDVDGWGSGKVEKLRTILTEADALPEEAERASRRGADGLRACLDAHLNTAVSDDIRDLLLEERDVMLSWFPTSS